ncbi:MAG: ORF6N domain-containing protein [Pontiellaceae bacterium]|nr:ORF6N domain-containing protein [Pontiellaceae bacterium]
MAKNELNPMSIYDQIYLIRNRRVMLDFELAALYGVTTSAFNQAVSRKQERFPDDFMFQLDREEFANLISQNVISSRAHGGRRRMPHVFTEQGVAMLSSVLNSARAVEVNIAIMRVFVKVKQTLLDTAELALKFEQLEQAVTEHDGQIDILFKAINELLAPSEPKKKYPLGFAAADKDK